MTCFLICLCAMLGSVCMSLIYLLAQGNKGTEPVVTFLYFYLSFICRTCAIVVNLTLCCLLGDDSKH